MDLPVARASMGLVSLEPIARRKGRTKVNESRLSGRNDDPTTPTAGRPLVGIPADLRALGGEASRGARVHLVGHKYVTAVSEGAGCWPILVPALGDWYGQALDWPGALFELVDGLLITGSPSNVEPARYGGPPAEPGTLADLDRDATVLPILEPAIRAGVPVLALCRGLQEVNVALGGTLHQKVQEVPGRADHRADDARPFAEQYGPAHPVDLVPGGLLAELAGGATRLEVNSLHSQGVNRLAPGLTVEATALDGTIEAVRVTDAPGFALALQWHPEWRFWADPVSSRLFAAFGDAVRARRRARAPAAS